MEWSVCIDASYSWFLLNFLITLPSFIFSTVTTCTFSFLSCSTNIFSLPLIFYPEVFHCVLLSRACRPLVHKFFLLPTCCFIHFLFPSCSSRVVYLFPPFSPFLYSGDSPFSHPLLCSFFFLSSPISSFSFLLLCPTLHY